jgi:hypothetical protein
MYQSYSVPGRGRGSVVGNLLVWLVGASTLGGALFLWLGDHRALDPGTPAEIAARTAPLGRLTLVEVSPESTESAVAAAEPGSETGAGGVDSPPADIPPATQGSEGLVPSSVEAPSAQGPVARESADVEAVEKTVAPPAAADTRPAGGLAGIEAPAADSDAEAPTEERPAKSEPMAPDTVSAPATEMSPGANQAVGSSPSQAAVPMGEPAARRPRPAVPPGPPWYGPYQMVPIHRPDLPGAPYQLVPLVPGGQ